MLPLLTCAMAAACGHESQNDAFAADSNSVATIGPTGEARIFTADQDSSGTRLCFDAPDLGIAPGAPVTVVHSAFPQFATVGRLGKRAKAPCFPPPRSSADSMQYIVDAPGDTIGPHGVPIVILGKLPAARMRGDTVTLEIEAGKEPWRFRTCASTEGVHATAWSGVPLASTRRWHAYYYLGYDVEPDCTDADFREDSATTGN